MRQVPTPSSDSRVAEIHATSLEELMPKAREERAQNPPDDDDDEIDERSVLFSVYDVDDDSFADDSFDEEELDHDDDLDDDELDHDDLDDDDLDDDDELLSEESEDEADDLAEIACTPDEEIGFLIAELSCVADPLSVDLIETAFREKLVSREIVSKGYVEKKYKAAEEVVQAGDVVEAGAEENWLSNYRLDYEGYLEDTADETLKRSRRPDSLAMPWQDRDDDLDDETEPLPVTSTIRNTGPKLGRNDPCWCGSGKKYKKCHHGKDAPGRPTVGHPPSSMGGVRARLSASIALELTVEIGRVSPGDEFVAHQIAGAPGILRLVLPDPQEPAVSLRRVCAAFKSREISGKTRKKRRRQLCPPPGFVARRARDGPPEAFQADLVSSEDLYLLPEGQSGPANRLDAHDFLKLRN